MIYSMTGFGKKTFEISSKTFSIEIKSLNSKQTDIHIKIPQLYKEKELELRTLISSELSRGKIEFILYLDQVDESIIPQINKDAVKSYFQQIGTISAELSIPSTDQQFLWATILRLPESLRTDSESLNDEEWEGIKKNVLDVLQHVRDFRLAEGKILEQDIVNRIMLIGKYLDEIRPFEEARKTNIMARIRNNLNEFISSESIDENRFEQELIYYLEKFDITEEKVRLNNHCNYFMETIGSDDSNGKKLGFIAQEIGREINTIGSKANDSDIQKLVVQMKDELEKIKEQLMNVL